jgi:hypothetical protein
MASCWCGHGTMMSFMGSIMESGATTIIVIGVASLHGRWLHVGIASGECRQQEIASRRNVDMWMFRWHHVVLV